MNLTAQPTAHGVALVLRGGKVSGGRRSAVAMEKEAAGHREPYIAHRIRVTQEAGEALPLGQFELCFRAVNDRLPEGDGEADAGVIDLVVVGGVRHQTPKIVCIEPDHAAEDLGRSPFVVVALGGLDWQAGEVRVEGSKSNRI